MDERVMELTRSEEVKGMMPASDGINIVRWFAVESERNRRESIERHRAAWDRSVRHRQYIRTAMVIGGMVGIIGGAGTVETGDFRIGAVTMVIGFLVGMAGVLSEVLR